MVTQQTEYEPFVRLPGDRTHLQDVDVAIVMEFTYPFLKGGVSAVVQDMIVNHPHLSFGIIHIMWDSKASHEFLYDVPKNVAWIDVEYLALSEHTEQFNKAVRAKASLKGHTPEELTGQLSHALKAVKDNDMEPLWRLYDDAFNPLTRTHTMWPILATKPFMNYMSELVGDSDMPLGDLFWTARDFANILFVMTEKVFPKAKVYHAHTTGYASLISAFAARQQDGRFLLTEHNLYIRDTVNTMLDRRMDQLVVRDSPEALSRNIADKLWMTWWIEMGVFTYPAADLITYLYPLAIKEAENLGGDPSKSIVQPNGMDWEEFEGHRNFRKAKLPEILSSEKKQWRFACIARVVPIKGIGDLIHAAAKLVQMGHRNFTIDVMGPTEHDAAYYKKCIALAEELGVTDLVNFLGTVKVRELIKEYDALVLSSYNEGQPIVVLEAMACGLPIVGTNVGGMDQIVEDPLPGPDGNLVGACGLLVQPGDSDHLAQGMVAMMESGALYREWHENATSRLQGTFLMHTVMEQYDRIYQHLMEQADAEGYGGSNIKDPVPSKLLNTPAEEARVAAAQEDAAQSSADDLSASASPSDDDLPQGLVDELLGGDQPPRHRPNRFLQGSTRVVDPSGRSRFGRRRSRG
jgi:glycosyltransferase involved in cell wall biosynthesis